MRCPFCGGNDTSVKDSRTADDMVSIRRRRVCESCGARFTTFERIQLRELFVLKRGGKRVLFNREKLTQSITTATHKRSIDPEKVEMVINGIIRQLETLGETEISTKYIGEIVMKALFYLDPVAYVRFASVYHEFNNVNNFIQFISNMESGIEEETKD